MNNTATSTQSLTLSLFAVCGAGILWGTGALVVDILVTKHGFTPENISFWRFLIGDIVLITIFGRKIFWHKLKPLLLTVVLAGIAMAGYVLLWFLGIEQIGPAIPTLIALCLPPVIVTIITVLKGQEKVDLKLILVLFGAILGTILIILKDDDASTFLNNSNNLLLGVAYSLGSAFLYAGFSMTSGRISKALGAGPATTCLTIVATLVMSLFAFSQPFIWPNQLPPQTWFLYLGVVTAALALLAFSWGAVRLKPTTLTVGTLLEPLTAVVLSAFLLDQAFGISQWIGSALLLSSIWLLGNRTKIKMEPIS
ncbi:DMT family transporter [Halarcobacter ebronensis]|uniref:EamA family transporter n=1 Tax=Halarcobacter ebronensis TaxID=1462615 RepID=A0A4Q1AKH9_9BACT|nr:DMT family transporter [Halarcobacter ebronensis]QKF83161.1 DMT family transporter [Halarcobacter ebronensis]RXK05201.1 EamA family transporter [Halarcobacter ebronensis]